MAVNNKTKNVVSKDSMNKDEKEKVVRDIYNCVENPLSYIIEPKGSIKITDKDDETKKEDLERII